MIKSINELEARLEKCVQKSKIICNKITDPSLEEFFFIIERNIEAVEDAIQLFGGFYE